MLFWAVIVIFILTFALIAWERFDKALITMMGAVLMIVMGVMNFEEALEVIEFETIVLLMSMMLLVEVARESRIFSWLTVKMAHLSKGNPLFLFLLFTGITGFTSAFLDNVTTIVLMVPITVALVKGMGRDPRPYILGEIFFSNLGGALTLIGDPPNIIIGGATGLSFNQFIVNLAIPVLVSIGLISLLFVITHWKHLKPIGNDLKKLFLSQLLLQKIDYLWRKEHTKKSFMIKSVVVMGVTFMGFLLQKNLGLSVAVIALTGALLLLLVAAEEADLKLSLRSVEWSTLLFFAGLFVMVGAIERVGALEYVSELIINLSKGNYVVLLLSVVWISGLTSMILDNIPFVTLMVPIIFSIQAELPTGADPVLLWWALSMGACFGGNGTLIGASANVIGVDLARKEGVDISFLSFMKYGFPFTVVSLIVASLYLTLRVI